MRLLIVFFVFLSGPTYAEQFITPDEFAAMSDGQSMYFTRNGQFYGAEQFLEDRRTIWKYSDGTCTNGVWYPVADMICFRYEDSPAEHCWRMIDYGDRVTIRSDGSQADQDVLLHSMDDRPLECGPELLS